MFCDFAFVPVGTGNGKAQGMKQLGEPAHTNAANSNKMNLVPDDVKSISYINVHPSFYYLETKLCFLRFIIYRQGRKYKEKGEYD